MALVEAQQALLVNVEKNSYIHKTGLNVCALEESVDRMYNRIRKMTWCLVLSLICISFLLPDIDVSAAASIMPLQSETVVGSYVNLTNTVTLGTVYQNGTPNKTLLQAPQQGYFIYKVSGKTETQLNVTLKIGIPNSTSPAQNIPLISLFDQLHYDCLDYFPYMNETNKSGYLTAYESPGGPGVPVLLPNTTATVSRISFEFQNRSYPAYLINVTGYTGNQTSVLPFDPSRFTYVFDAYSGIVFSFTSNITFAPAHNESGYITSSFNLHSTNLRLTAGTQQPILLILALLAIVVFPTAYIVNRKRKRL